MTLTIISQLATQFSFTIRFQSALIIFMNMQLTDADIELIRDVPSILWFHNSCSLLKKDTCCIVGKFGILAGGKFSKCG